MSTVTLSAEYQVVIPKELRESMGLKSGQKFQVMQYNGRIELIPIRPVEQLRGILRGIDTDVPRDEDRI